MAAVAAAQYYQAEKARGANQAQLNQMKADFQTILPPDYDLSITAPPELIRQAVPPPNYDDRALTPEQFKVIGKYSPEVAAYVAEKNPELVRQSAVGDEGRSAQLDALRKMRGIATSDFDPEFAASIAQASRQAQTDAQSRSQSILTDFQRRGAGNSGLAAVLQQNASADAMDREASTGVNAAAQAYRNKIDAIRQSGSMGSDIAQQDQSLQGRNADIINSYNQRMTRNNQDWQNQRATTMNDAQRRNLDMNQDVANRNVGVQNQFQVDNRQRQDMLASSKYKTDLTERDYQNMKAEKLANWAQGQKEYGNTQKRNSFDDQLRSSALKQGIGNQQMAMNNQAAQDRNQVLQGVGQAGAGYFQSQADEARWNKAEAGRNKRAEMKYGFYDEDEDDETVTGGSYRRTDNLA
jgi:hypothetical protein